jgi:hypothetical protein
VKARGLQIQGHPGLHSKTCLKINSIRKQRIKYILNDLKKKKRRRYKDQRKLQNHAQVRKEKSKPK